MWAIAIAFGTILIVLLAWRRSGRSALDFFGLHGLRIYAHLWHRFSAKGAESIPATGPVLLVMNHTASVDPALVIHGSPRVPGFLIAKEYYRGPFKFIITYMKCVPTARDGQDVWATRQALRQLRAGGILGIFPEGNLSNAGRKKPRPGKPGAAYLALKSRATVVPVLIRGGAQTWHVLQSWLSPSRRAVRLTYGRPVDLSAYYERRINRKILEEVTTLLMRRVEELDPVHHASAKRR